jgi:ankyrin repeat protein
MVSTNMNAQRSKYTWLAIPLLLVGLLGRTAAAPAAEVADAVKNRNASALQTLLKQRVDVNAPQADGTTALHWAAHWNDEATVNQLLRAGANAKAANRYGATPLSEAVTSGSSAMIEALLRAGADPKTLTTEDGETVLMTAARAGNVDAVRILLERGADVNAREKYKGQTALMWAAAERHSAVVKLLLDRGADWKTRSHDRETRLPRLSAASSVTPLARGGFPALLYTAREGDVETAQVMLSGGVDPNYGDVDNTTALMVSILNKKYTLAKFLLDRGADPNIVDASGRTALYAIVEARNEDWTALPERKTDDPLPSVEVLKALLTRKADPNVALNKVLPGKSGMDGGDTTLGAGTTALLRAARSGDGEAMRLLLAGGADPKLAVRDGTNALMLAAGVGYRDKNTKGTESEALDALKVAIGAGLDLNEANSKGEMAIHGAALRGADTIVQFLVDSGARLNIKTKQGFTPLDIAMGKSSLIQLPVPKESTVALLRKLGGLEGKDVN